MELVGLGNIRILTDYAKKSPGITPIYEYWHEFELVSLMSITGTVMQCEVLCLLWPHATYIEGQHMASTCIP
jgi:hypothetical protein